MPPSCTVPASNVVGGTSWRRQLHEVVGDGAPQLTLLGACHPCLGLRSAQTKAWSDDACDHGRGISYFLHFIESMESFDFDRRYHSYLIKGTHSEEFRLSYLWPRGIRYRRLRAAFEMGFYLRNRIFETTKCQNPIGEGQDRSNAFRGTKSDRYSGI